MAYKKSNHWDNRSEHYKANKLRRQNNSKKKESIVARLSLWEAEGRPGKVPAIRTPVADAISIYANHGVSQELYFSHWGRYIEEPENKFNDMDSRSTGMHRSQPNYAKVERAREAIVKSPQAQQRITELETNDEPDGFKIKL
jgi:hypothetical protein